MHRSLLTFGLGVAALGAIAFYVREPTAAPPASVAPATAPPTAASPATALVPVNPAFTPSVAFSGSEHDGPLDVALSLDVNAAPADAPSTRYLVVTVRAPEETNTTRHPVDLSLVMDTSGSMGSSGKMDQARRAALALTDALGADDRLALVTFESTATTRLPLSGAAREKASGLIRGLRPGTGTNLSEGLTQGLGQLTDVERVRKVILMTDGQANEGVTSPDALTRMARHEGVTVSALGMGLDYNEELLAKIADAGGGMYEFVDSRTDLAGLYAAELHRSATQVAQGTALHLTFGPGAHPLRVYAWDASVQGQSADLAIGSLSAGQVRTVVVQVAVDSGAEPGVIAAVLTGKAAAGRGAAGEGVTFHESATLTVPRVASEADAVRLGDPSAQAAASNAVAAAAVADANVDYKNGDTAQGQQKLRDAAAVLGARGDVLGNATLNENAAMLRSLGYVDAPSSMKGQSKAMRSLGRGEESSKRK